MRKGDLYLVARLLVAYDEKRLMYIFDEDILGLKGKIAADVKDNEALFLEAFVETIALLNNIYRDDHRLVVDFLTTKNSHHPFNDLSPVAYVSKQPARMLSTRFFVLSMKVYMENQFLIEHHED